ncbi:zinc-binding metallopeptidase family protein [Aquabacterium sp. OR-4]|uniref:zinc-binding metallopeptidase family protein n=1 Tax=Aquabacterium sp. OR-4 TaxID=2978127 RepID=UPI0028C9AEAA|nr:putative zinc-binding metallopeptidase [Aquabacterium sp. OR-4]MDT7835052.1 putative zinc-binding metallopeptidase [Aquabacterium sp. OR-4]
MTPFRCTQCQATVFFENTECVQCHALLGFEPAAGRMQAYRADPAAPADAPPRWLPALAGEPATPCHNRIRHQVCNWMVDDAAQGHTLCRSCRLTRTIPDLGVPGHLQRWARIEQAKRRLLFGLDRLGLRPQPRRTPPGPAGAGLPDMAPETATSDTATPDTGLCFDLLADAADGVPVRTGHDRGVITLNIAEADDAHREAERVRLGEPLRTLLGHLRHEVAHYLQYRWIDGDAQRSAHCRAVFGDERADYAQALQAHYRQGPAEGWAQRHISAYASAHPWEDWAETCAHWLLIEDAVQTATAWGLQLDGPAPARPDGLHPGEARDTVARVLQQWLPVAQFLNAMNRSIGVHDSYPFLMPQAVLDKLAAVAALLGEPAPQAGPPAVPQPMPQPAMPRAPQPPQPPQPTTPA